MQINGMRVLANGLRTEHPVPGIPFVDDSHIPVEDGDAVEAVGRNVGEGMWGRIDEMRPRTGRGPAAVRSEAGWKAFTTDPIRKDLAWVVRWHPSYGRSVWLVADEDAAVIHSDFEDSVVLWRSGGYWLGHDGTWYRPAAIFDYALEEFVTRPVPGASIVSVADLLGDPAKVTQLPAGEASGQVMSVHGIGLERPPTLSSAEYQRQLWVWAGNRPAEARSLKESIVDLAAPELNAGQLLNVTEAAKAAGINVGTLRGYISRGENEVPDPQAVVGASAVWSRPVIDQWIEARRYTSEAAEEAVSGRIFGDRELPVGVADAWEKVHYWLLSDLTRAPEVKPILARWRRGRSRDSAQELAKELGLSVALNLSRLIPLDALVDTTAAAILGEMREQAGWDSKEDSPFYVLLPKRETMLSWMVRTSPGHARDVVNQVIGDALRANEEYRTSREDLLVMFKRGLTHGRKEAHLTREQVEAFLDTIVHEDTAESGAGSES